MRPLVISFLGAIILFTTFAVPGQTEEADSIDAIVNGSIITSQQVLEIVKPQLELLFRQYPVKSQFEKKVEQVRTETLNELIERLLILFDFKDAGYKLPESIVDDVVNERIKQRFGTREEFTRTLQAQGKTFETFRQEQRDNIIVEALRAKTISSEKVLVSPQKIQRYYNDHQANYKEEDKVKLRLIVLNVTTANPLDEVRKLGQEILSKIEQGAPFSQMASVYSEGSFRAQGGNRDWVERSKYKKELADIAFTLKPGQHSGLIETPQACFILMVEDFRAAHVKPVTEVRDEIELVLRTEERNRLKEKWINRLKKKALVRYIL